MLHKITIPSAMLLLSILSAQASAELLDHTFVLTLNHSSGARMAIPPSIAALEVTGASELSGPIYTGNKGEVDNPLYDSAAAPGSPGSVISVSWEFAGTESLMTADGIVHRDIATRNMLITTSEGVYEADAAASLLFQNDGPENLQGAGPIRWMAPESVQTQSYTPTAGDARVGSWELAAFSYFDVNYPVPEPTTAWLAVAAVLGGGCWRRR